MRRNRKAKIVATLGPASSTPVMIKRLAEAGADVFRLNFSHGTQEEQQARVRSIRLLEHKVRKPLGVLMDLQGPKLRVGKMAEGGVDACNLLAPWHGGVGRRGRGETPLDQPGALGDLDRPPVSNRCKRVGEYTEVADALQFLVIGHAGAAIAEPDLGAQVER